MKIALVQQNYHIGNFELNTQKIIEGIGKAKAMGADLVMFTELCVCGYAPRDFLEFDDFIRQCSDWSRQPPGSTLFQEVSGREKTSDR